MDLTKFDRIPSGSGWGRVALGLMAVAVLVGCGTGPRSDSSPVGDSSSPYRLKEEPADPIGIDAAFATLTEEGDQAELTLVGRIPKQISQGIPPWGEKEATFVVVDATKEGDSAHSGPGHDPDNCPFCKRRREEGKAPLNSLALIQIVDDQGKVVPHDPRTLLGVKENQVVVARGDAHRDSLGNIVLAARNIYVRPSE